MRTPLTNDAELQARDHLFAFRQHSYDLTQKLTYFVISIELIFCGYMLLNAEKLVGIQGASYLVATCGIAAFFGILWRFFYNQTYHDHAHGVHSLLHQIARHSQIVCYWIYVALSIASFVWALSTGFAYLEKTNTTQKKAASSQSDKTTKATVPAAQGISPSHSETHRDSQNPSDIKSKSNAAPSKQTKYR